MWVNISKEKIAVGGLVFKRQMRTHKEMWNAGYF